MSWQSKLLSRQQTTQSQTIAVKYSPKSLKNNVNTECKDRIPRHKEVTPDPSDDFLMTNAGNFAKPGLKHKKHTPKMRIVRSSLDVMNKDFTFHHPYKQLISVQPDKYLNETIIIQYFSAANGMVLEGRLTCIAHCGQYRIEDVRYRGGVNINCTHKLRDDYWLHINSTRKVYLADFARYEYCRNANKLQYIDITAMLCDIIKFKMITYFLYEYGDRLEYLGKTYVDGQLRFLGDGRNDFSYYINCLNDISIEKIAKTVKGRKRLKRIAELFVKKELGNVKYLCRRNWNVKPRYLKQEHLLQMIIGYRDLILAHIELEDSYEERLEVKLSNQYNDKIADNKHKFEYFNWN